MHLHHCSQDEIVRRCRDLDVFHGADDGPHLISIVAHHGTGVDKVMPFFPDGLTVRLEYITQMKALWCSGDQRTLSVGNVERAVSFGHDESLCGWHTGDA